MLLARALRGQANVDLGCRCKHAKKQMRKQVMTTKKYEFENGNCCSPQWVTDNDYESNSGPCSEKRKVLINPPPEDGKCMICGRHVSELESFGGPGDPCLGDFSGAKLTKTFREDDPGYITAHWECRDCLGRPGPLWAIDEEDRLGRPLTEREAIDLRYKLELSILEMHEETTLSESEK